MKNIHNQININFIYLLCRYHFKTLLENKLFFPLTMKVFMKEISMMTDNPTNHLYIHFSSYIFKYKYKYKYIYIYIYIYIYLYK